MSYPLQKFESDYVDLRLVLINLIAHKRKLIFAGFITCLLSMLYVLVTPTKYQATVLLEIHHTQENSLGALSNFNKSLESDASANDSIPMQIALMRSKFILEPVIHALHLENKKYSESEIIKRILSHLTILDLSGTDNATGILQLSMIGTNPQDVIRTINQIALTTQQQDTTRKSEAAKKTLTFLYEQLPILQASLRDAEAKLNQYRSTSGKIDPKLQTEYLLNHLSEINKQLEATNLKQMEMSQQYTRYHPFIIALNEKQKALTTERNDIMNQIKKLPAADQAATNLARDVSVKNSLYMILLNKIHEQQVITAGIVSDITILNAATFADKYLPLNLSLVAFLSTIIGFLLASFAMTIKFLFTQRSTYPEWNKSEAKITA